jgi:hypothetical protein
VWQSYKRLHVGNLSFSNLERRGEITGEVFRILSWRTSLEVKRRETWLGGTGCLSPAAYDVLRAWSEKCYCGMSAGGQRYGNVVRREQVGRHRGREGIVCSTLCECNIDKALVKETAIDSFQLLC